ncbi:MAG: hypothetical protein AB7K52_03805 [Phycisphaerales bacterium]
MRNLARIGLVAAFASCAIIGGCNKSARVEESASATKTCTTTCSDKSATCADKAATCSEGKMAQEGKTGCCAAKQAEAAGQCPMSKNQN